jgi:hypothetical protein
VPAVTTCSSCLQGKSRDCVETLTGQHAACRVGQEAFAFIPFLDQANHAAQPNADFKPAVDGLAYELVAVQDIAAGAEVTISYTGPAG